MCQDLANAEGGALDNWTPAIASAGSFSGHPPRPPGGRAVRVPARPQASQQGSDPLHGARAERRLPGLIPWLPDLLHEELELLEAACLGHTGGRSRSDVTVLTCWDADRLDLRRVGITPDPRHLCTPAARRRDIVAAAHFRALAWLEQSQPRGYQSIRYSRIGTSGRMKEAGTDLGHLLQASHHALDHRFEFVLGLDGGLGDAGLDVPPGQLVGVELRA